MLCIKNISFIVFLSLMTSGCSKRCYTLCQAAATYKVVNRSEDSTASSIALMVQNYTDSVQMRLLEPIARITIPLTKAQPESTLGNLVADAALTAARQEDPKVSAAIIPFYTLGQSYIAPGTLTRKNCYDILPYENRLLIVELTGAQIRILCDSIARQKGWPISGLTFVIDSGSSKQHQINGAAIHDQLLYKIVVTEYVVSDRIAAAFRLNTGRHYLARSLRSALIAYLQERQQPDHVLQVLLENRIQYAD